MNIEHNDIIDALDIFSKYGEKLRLMRKAAVSQNKRSRSFERKREDAWLIRLNTSKNNRTHDEAKRCKIVPIGSYK